MTLTTENLAGCATGEVLDCHAGRLDEPKYSTAHREIKDLLRLSRLQRRHGLSGSRAALVAVLAFGEGVR